MMKEQGGSALQDMPPTTQESPKLFKGMKVEEKLEKDVQTLQTLKNQRQSMLSVVKQKAWRRNSAKPTKPVDDLVVRGLPGLSNEKRIL